MVYFLILVLVLSVSWYVFSCFKTYRRLKHLNFVSDREEKDELSD